MDEYGPATYGDRIADIYDELYLDALEPTTQEAVTALEELAGGGRALELGIGTGRGAIPLAERGVKIYGIDASEAMVARLRAKPGGDNIPVTIGAFADVAVEGTFSLIFVVFNTFFGLLTQEDQVRCFSNVALHLTENGVFVLELFVPDLTRFDHGQGTAATRVETNRVTLEANHHDPINQRVISQHVIITEDGTRLNPVRVRYAWPAELDLMARLAGLRLRERWSGWHDEPFTVASTKHVSVYGRG